MIGTIEEVYSENSLDDNKKKAPVTIMTKVLD